MPKSRKTRNSGPRVLKSRDIPSLASYIKSKDCKNIVLLLGAGVSTSAGIPDFRSPKTGLYSNLARLNLPHPEAVFEIHFFRTNPVPFYTLAHELYPGKFRPTITHSFVRVLTEKNLLLKCFTQNIDTLERRAGVPDEKIIEAHGSFATQRCIDCKTPFDAERMKKHILEKRIARCDRCKGLIKPDIVFFGESLPPQFIHSIPLLQSADLLIVMGTSLTVHPFASLAGIVSDDCPRVLINMERVGDFGERADDVILLGKCDDIVKDLCKELGWGDELSEAWDKTAELVESILEPAGDGEKGDEGGATKKEVAKTATSDSGDLERLQDEVDALTAAVEESLKLTEVYASTPTPGNSEPTTAESSPSSEEESKKDPNRRSSVLGRLVSKLSPTDHEKNQAGADKEKL